MMLKIILISFYWISSIFGQNSCESEYCNMDLSNSNVTEILIRNSTQNLTARSSFINKIECEENLTIEKLILSDNKLTAKSINCLSQAKSMLELDLSGNDLGKLEPEIFAEMTNLTFLNLSNTNIAPISANLFSHNKIIKILDISNNNLNSLDLHMFMNLKDLEVWDLSGNNLTKIKNYDKFSSAEFFPKLRLIGLDNNAFKNQVISSMESSFKKQNITFMRDVGLNYQEPPPTSKKEQHSQNVHEEMKNLSIENFQSEITQYLSQKFNEIESNLGIFKIFIIILVSIQIAFMIMMIKLYLTQRRLRMKNLICESSNTLETNINL